jgi:rubrerythrin
MTEENLKAAFSGESQAHMRYLIFSGKAAGEGLNGIAKLFKAIAYAEQVHATNHFKAMELLGESSGNLDTAIAGETFEVEEMYPAYDAVAKLQEEKKAKRSIHFALEAEKIHADLYSRAKKAADAGKDLDVEKVSICSRCGHTVIGDAPDRCPVCGARKGEFRIF